MNSTTLLVRRDQPGLTRVDTRDESPLTGGQVRVRVDFFALTANNITYAALGDAMNYWRFFPAADDNWGIVPAWGFGTVTESLHEGVPIGERLYGYWPMSSQAVLQPGQVDGRGLADGAPHRASLHPVYNHYARCNADPLHRAADAELEALLRPLFFTAWLIDDFLGENDFFGARTMLLSSASSKTAIATACSLAQHPQVEAVGLTSESNMAFCRSLGCYDRVLNYEQLDTLPADLPCVYVDMAGNASLRRRIHEHCAELRFDCSVGAAHVQELGGARGLPGPRATRFFAPAQAARRQSEWGMDEFDRRLAQSWHAFTTRVRDSKPPLLTVRHHVGPAAVQAAYTQAFGGPGDPRIGHILSLHPVTGLLEASIAT